MNRKTAAIIIGIVFIAVGLLGFVENPIVGEDALFHTDTTHNLVHLISGALFLLFALAVTGYLSLFMMAFGVVYFGLGILGLVQIGDSGMTELVGFLHVNGADNYLHIGLGIVIFLAALLPGIPQKPAKAV